MHKILKSEIISNYFRDVTKGFSFDLCDGGQNLPPLMVGIGLRYLSENLVATSVAPVAPVDTSLKGHSS